jgi:hypothetical protein
MKKLTRGAEELIDAVEGIKFFPGVIAPAADIVSDEGVIFLFCETIIVFVEGTAMGEAEGFHGLRTGEGVVVNKPGAVIAVELDNFEQTGIIGGFQALQGPGMGLVEQTP